jgi:hypothetical protein
MWLPIRRIFDENRRRLIPVVGGLALNVVLFVAVVYPLGIRARAAEARAQAAAQQQQAAERDDAEARGVVQGRDRTGAALKTFYTDVLPPNLAEARQAIFLRLTQLAELHNLQPSRRSAERELDKESSLARVRIQISLQGDYEDIRRFIHQLESGTDFIVIDVVTLRQGAELGLPLMLDLTLSTYYRAGNDGA